MRTILCLALLTACASDPTSVPIDATLDHADVVDVPVPYDADAAPLAQDAYGPLDAGLDAR